MFYAKIPHIYQLDTADQESLLKLKCLLLLLAKYQVSIAVADDKHLQKTKQRASVAVAGFVLVINDLLHGAAWANRQGLEFDLYDRHAVDEQHLKTSRVRTGFKALRKRWLAHPESSWFCSSK